MSISKSDPMLLFSPVVSDLSEQGWFLFIAAPLLVKEVRQRRIEYESEGRND